MVLPSTSLPKAMICPATWAPTSISSSGSTVPLAVIVAVMSPRETVAVLYVVSPSPLRRPYQTVAAAIRQPAMRIRMRLRTQCFMSLYSIWLVTRLDRSLSPRPVGRVVLGVLFGGEVLEALRHRLQQPPQLLAIAARQVRQDGL